MHFFLVHSVENTREPYKKKVAKDAISETFNQIGAIL